MSDINNDELELDFHPSTEFKLGKPKEEYAMGNYELFFGKKTVFFSSKIVCPQTKQKIIDWVSALDLETVVMSGFQSEYEKLVLDELLVRDRKIVFVLARSLFGKCPEKFKTAYENGNILIISPFPDLPPYPTLDVVTRRNQFMVNAADEIVIGDFTVGGMIDKLLSSSFYTILGEVIIK